MENKDSERYRVVVFSVVNKGDIGSGDSVARVVLFSGGGLVVILVVSW